MGKKRANLVVEGPFFPKNAQNWGRRRHYDPESGGPAPGSSEIGGSLTELAPFFTRFTAFSPLAHKIRREKRGESAIGYPYPYIEPPGQSRTDRPGSSPGRFSSSRTWTRQGSPLSAAQRAAAPGTWRTSPADSDGGGSIERLTARRTGSCQPSGICGDKAAEERPQLIEKLEQRRLSRIVRPHQGR